MHTRVTVNRKEHKQIAIKKHDPLCATTLGGLYYLSALQELTRAVRNTKLRYTDLNYITPSLLRPVA